MKFFFGSFCSFEPLHRCLPLLWAEPGLSGGLWPLHLDSAHHRKILQLAQCCPISSGGFCFVVLMALAFRTSQSLSLQPVQDRAPEVEILGQEGLRHMLGVSRKPGTHCHPTVSSSLGEVQTQCWHLKDPSRTPGPTMH